MIDGAQTVFEHGVNCRAALDRFLAGPANTAEGDVEWGTLHQAPDRLCAIMAHSPDTTSDLSFDAWVGAARAQCHAIKVDLKCPRALDEVIEVLHRHGLEHSRLILNADVVAGPAGDPPALEVAHLVRFREEFSGAVISAGATTGAGGGAYSPEHLAALLGAADHVGPPVTVPLRAEFVLADPSILAALSARGVHVSIWNSPDSFAASPSDVAYFRRLLPRGYLDLLDANGVEVR